MPKKRAKYIASHSFRHSKESWVKWQRAALLSGYPELRFWTWVRETLDDAADNVLQESDEA